MAEGVDYQRALDPQPVPADAAPEQPQRRRPRVLGAWRQYGRFISVGFLNAAVDLGVLNLLQWIWHYSGWVLTLENSLAVALAVTNSYLWNSNWTFRRESDGSLRQITLFVAQSLINIAINDIALILTAGQVRELHLGPAWLPLNLSKGAAMAFASSASFLIMRFFVFRTRRAA